LKKHLHIITLNIPDPPDYGGMIDTYYRILSLHDQGIGVHLHCFEYGRSHSKELESFCETVNYYQRRSGFLSYLSSLPYIVSSRKSKSLLNNLRKDNWPILFDGLHTTYYTDHPALADRSKFVRAHNIEHQYYLELAKTESNPIQKFYFYLESVRLKRHEKTLSRINFILPISESEQEYFKRKYFHSILIPPFHPFKESISLPGIGEYAIFHGDLSVNDNDLISKSLIDNVFSRIPFPLIIAGKNPSSRLQKSASTFSNIKIIANPDNNKMIELIRNAHIQILIAESSNGFKLKLLIGLFAGRHCLVNSKMIHGTHTDKLCHTCNSYKDITDKVISLGQIEFTSEMVRERMNVLNQIYSNTLNAKKLIDLVFTE
jgi:hypothetical protein